jgi:uncharacterized Zn finger protein
VPYRLDPWRGPWPAYVPVAVRRQIARRDAVRQLRRGTTLAPVSIEGRAIARSVWGRAWCDNLEAYSDLANRLPRGRTYVRNGSVVHLEISPGTVTALVSGTELYRVSVTIRPLAASRWRALVKDCAGHIGSLVELLQGKLAQGVLEVLIRPTTGLFPAPREITYRCSCPDRAEMCKHVAATLYGVGTRLDTAPELFFRLRQVDQLDLVTAASRGDALGARRGSGKRLAPSALGAVFGIEFDAEALPAPPEPRPRSPRRR